MFGLLAPGCTITSGAVADGAPVDGSPIDAAVDSAAVDAIADTGCSGVDGDVVMYLTMNTPMVTIWPDLVGDHDGRTAPGTAGGLDGPSPDCGRAYSAASNNVRLVIADSPDFDLASGSLDVYAMVPAPDTGEHGIVSRDASGTALPGHFEIGFSPENQVVVRIQTDADTEAFRCSVAQAEGTWIHIGVNFGAPDLELFVDGVAAAGTTTTYSNAARTCGGAAFTDGIAGNDNPWVVGFSALGSEEGSDLPVSRPLGTAVDELRLSSVRRVYD